jgi:hypothetical protein
MAEDKTSATTFTQVLATNQVTKQSWPGQGEEENTKQPSKPQSKTSQQAEKR